MAQIKAEIAKAKGLLPESVNEGRSYYPDFLFQKEDGTYVIVEVKGDNKMDDPVVLAKQEFTQQLAVASGMTYQMIKSSDIDKDNWEWLVTENSIVQSVL